MKLLAKFLAKGAKIEMANHLTESVFHCDPRVSEDVIQRLDTEDISKISEIKSQSALKMHS